MRTSEIAKRYLDYFSKHDHLVMPSASLISPNPTTLFTIAGMVPFKPYFTGAEDPPFKRAVSVQKCVRTLDIVMDAILYGHKWAVDRSITKTYVKDVTETINAFMRDLKAQGAIINFEVYPDPELNTASQLEQGRVYWNIRFTDVPPAENPTFRVEVTNQWITEVLDI